MSAKEAREIANKVNSIETHKHFIINTIERSAKKGSYRCSYCYEGRRISVIQILNWLENQGYSCQVSYKNSEVQFNITWN